MLLFITDSIGQNCVTPFNIKFENRKTSSIDVSWSDINSSPLSWEMEIIEKGQPRTGIPNFINIIQKNTTLGGLQPSTAYEMYIRTVCSADKRSDWNVIPFTTLVTIPSACQINIPLKDNGTEIIYLDVQEQGILGKNVFLESVDIIVEHDWPADLNITLVSPQGQSLVLTAHNGNISDDFGDISDNSCLKVTSFAPQACTSLKSSRPPYLGVFKPDGDMTNWKPDTLSRGIWKLVVFDRAFRDAGTLKFIDIRFNRENCLVPENFIISKTDLNSISVKWDFEPPCNSVVFTMMENGDTLDPITVPCIEGQFTFESLKPNTEYCFSIASRCSFTSLSQNSCVIKGSTSCEPVSVSESFENFNICDPGCASGCIWGDNFWTNVKDDSTQDWVLWSGKTDTENTGPSGDITGSGKYIYIENNPQICDSMNKVILQSTCMQLKSNLSGCDMSFYYHMYGIDVQYLNLDISTDNGQTWENLFSANGDHGDDWKRTTLSLQNYDGKSGLFRFIGQSANGSFGDVAIDQIEFYKSTPQSGLNVYYYDGDGDGFGVASGKIEICASVPPQNYVRIDGDCDDNNADINPGATEIQCNNMDENCNGPADDQPAFNPIIINHLITHARCNGSKDGEISLDITGGTPPYIVTWNNGDTGQVIGNLSSDIYYANITDAGGCKIKSEFFQVNSLTNLDVIVTSMIQPSCLGIDNGALNIAHNTDHSPYTYKWSNGETVMNLINVSEGTYSVTVTDKNNCFAIKNEIVLMAKPSLLVGIKSLKHPFCAGQNTGRIELFTINGTAPYHYVWSTGDTTDILTQLAPKIYTCTVTDKSGCINVFETEVTAPDDIEINVISTESVRCFGESNGSIKTNIKGGTPPYSYLWNKQSERADDIFNLAAGIYILTVTDSNVCSKESVPITVSEPDLFEIWEDSIAPSSCILGKNGYIRLKTSGGTGNVNYVWSHDEISGFESDQLSTGNYSVTAFDINGCKASKPNIFVPFENIPLNIELTLLEDNLCYHQSSAKIAASISGGKSVFDYNWSHGVQYFEPNAKDTIEKLPAGTYNLTVTDAQGCVGSGIEIQILEKELFYYSVESIIPNICAGDSTGSIKLKIEGGTQPISISWNGGLYSGNEINSLPNGIYAGQIRDLLNCTVDISPLPVSSISDIVLTPLITDDTDNKGSGKICILPSGGDAPYKIKWSNGINDVLCIEQLRSGNYSITVTDANECVKKEDFVIGNITSTDHSQNLKIKLYPNPANDMIFIESSKIFSEINVLDLNGRTLITQENNPVISIQELLPGLYIVQIKLQDDTVSLRFTKI